MSDIIGLMSVTPMESDDGELWMAFPCHKCGEPAAYVDAQFAAADSSYGDAKNAHRWIMTDGHVVGTWALDGDRYLAFGEKVDGEGANDWPSYSAREIREVICRELEAHTAKQEGSGQL